VQAYLNHGLFTNALGIIDRQLKLAPNDPDWLFNRGNVPSNSKPTMTPSPLSPACLPLKEQSFGALQSRPWPA